jgi:hypothetical protein
MVKFTADNAKKKYDKRIMTLLGKWNRLLKGDIFTMDDEEYVWEIDVNREVGISLTLTEERVREGTGKGLAFYLDIVGNGGEILGVFCPYNYTMNLWAHDWVELEQRFKMFEKLSPNSILKTVMKKD